MEEIVFALDIGTRKVLGVVARPARDGYRILAVAREEHRERSMMDGQIHNIEEVASCIARITSRLEKRLGQPLTRVAVAAAGRSLSTVIAGAEEQFSPVNEISPEDVMRLELQAVQAAQVRLLDGARGADSAHYRCVGYSVLEYALDGRPIVSLQGQRGDKAAVTVIATFLPQVVIDSLFAVLKRAGLEMRSITLEPIAAINVAVPASMRLLNLALVDVGAGTSDIAVTRSGTIVGYDMVPVAGDEVTEELCHALLVDFVTGEQMKRSLSLSDEIQYRDALGQSRSVPARQVVDAILPAVNNLARLIAERITHLNGGPPQGVILVGGGSLTPRLPERLAAALGIEPSRVAVRGREMVSGFAGAKDKLSGPEAITPLGIVLSASHYQSSAFSNVEVNGRTVRLFNLGEVRVRDALLAAGFDTRRLQPRLGAGLMVYVRGEMQLVKGTLGRSAPLTLNGKPCNLDTPLRHGDQLQVGEATHGQDAAGHIADVLPPLPPRRVTVNNLELELHARITMNGRQAAPEDELVDNARIEYSYPDTVGEVLRLWENRTNDRVVTPLEFILNGRRVSAKPRPAALLLNGKTADVNAPVKDGDRLKVEARPVHVKDVLPPELGPSRATVQVNGKKLVLIGPGPRIRLNGEASGPEAALAPGDRLEAEASPPVGFTLADVFRHYPFDPSPAGQGRRLIMTVNGAPADFITPIADGDALELRWDG